jgi:hypothetical protein
MNGGDVERVPENRGGEKRKRGRAERGRGRRGERENFFFLGLMKLGV